MFCRYKKAIKKVKQLIKDQPMKSLDKAMWWIEYVLRHKGAAHLRSPAVGMPWYKYFLVDILILIAFFAIIFCLTIFVFVSFVFKFCYKCKRLKNMKVD